jgi:hypothetical protein
VGESVTPVVVIGLLPGVNRSLMMADDDTSSIAREVTTVITPLPPHANEGVSFWDSLV